MQIRQCFKLNANKSKKLEPYVTRTEINAKCNETFTQLFDDMNVYPGYVLKDFCGICTRLKDLSDRLLQIAHYDTEYSKW